MLYECEYENFPHPLSALHSKWKLYWQTTDSIPLLYTTVFHYFSAFFINFWKPKITDWSLCWINTFVDCTKFCLLDLIYNLLVIVYFVCVMYKKKCLKIRLKSFIPQTHTQNVFFSWWWEWNKSFYVINICCNCVLCTCINTLFREGRNI